MGIFSPPYTGPAGARNLRAGLQLRRRTAPAARHDAPSYEQSLSCRVAFRHRASGPFAAAGLRRFLLLGQTSWHLLQQNPFSAEIAASRSIMLLLNDCVDAVHSFSSGSPT